VLRVLTMPLTAQIMASMDDGHLLAAIDAELDALTSTDIERELAKRFESLLDQQAAYEPTFKVLDDHGIEDAGEIDKLLDALIQDTDNTVALLNAINNAGFDSPDALIAALQRAEKFDQIEDVAGDLIAALQRAEKFDQIEDVAGDLIAKLTEFTTTKE
jgi:hypothetical protein